MTDENIEPQTVNIKDLASDIGAIKEFLSKQAEKPSKGVSEAKIETPKGKTLVESMRDFLLDDRTKNYTSYREAIGAQTASSAIPSVWSADPEILSPEGADGYFLTSIVKWKDDVKGKVGQTVYVQTIAAVADAGISSGTEPTFTASTVSSVPVTLTQRGHGFYVTKADLEDVQDGTLEALMTQSKNAILRKVDDYFLSSIEALAGNAGAGTITEAVAMASTMLPKLWGSLMAGSYAPKACIMHPVPYASLLGQAQFTNAATFGGDSVVKTGKIPTYLGMDIVPLVQGTLNYGGTVGTYKTYMIAQGAMVGAIKRDIEVEKEYYVKDQRNYVVSSIRFGGTVVHTNGIGLLLTVG